jgi:hypothetical protein
MRPVSSGDVSINCRDSQNVDKNGMQNLNPCCRQMV